MSDESVPYSFVYDAPFNVSRAVRRHLAPIHVSQVRFEVLKLRLLQRIERPWDFEVRL